MYKCNNIICKHNRPNLRGTNFKTIKINILLMDVKSIISQRIQFKAYTQAYKNIPNYS